MTNEQPVSVIGLATMLAIIFVLVALAILAPRPACSRELVIASTYNDGTVDANGMTVAHPTLKHGTRLTVSHGHRKIMVTVNDTGPAPWTKRKLDLTPAVNRYLQCAGLCRVIIEPWPPFPKPRPDIREASIMFGEE